MNRATVIVDAEYWPKPRSATVVCASKPLPAARLVAEWRTSATRTRWPLRSVTGTFTPSGNCTAPPVL